MIIKEAKYIGSFVKVSQCPEGDKPEFAFIGRSNVGKSSLINMITGRKSLAIASHTPGKTQTINHFIINDKWYLVDLPGYGYAKVSKTSRKNWEKMIRDYLTKRENLLCVFVLIDSRIPPQQIDLEFIDWLGEMHIPFVLVFTKTDKQTQQKVSANMSDFKKEMLKNWQFLPQFFKTSSVKSSGRDDLLKFIEETMETASADES